MKQSYPLEWPLGYPRSINRIDSRFKQSLSASQIYLRDEINLIKGQDLVVSTNLRVKTDGLIYATDMNKLIEDPGVAIYFKRKGIEVAMCCDQYRRVWENVYALARSIKSIRQIERDGVSDFISRAFAGLRALPESIIMEEAWYTVLGVPKDATGIEIREAYKKLAKNAHPDTGGSEDEFSKINRAHRQGMDQLVDKI